MHANRLLMVLVGALSLAILADGTAAAQSNCPPSPPPPKLVRDFNPEGPVAPHASGTKYPMPEDLMNMAAMATWLWDFYNSGLVKYGAAALLTGRHFPEPTDWVIFSDGFLEEVRAQYQVKNLVRTAELALKQNAEDLAKQLACGQSGSFSNRGMEVVMGDEDSYGMHLAVGSFSIYWDATCEIGPKSCCTKDDGCDSGYADTTQYKCELTWTAYDTYNFGFETGTGGTGWLKAINPAGWLGTRFSSIGHWHDRVSGTTRHCLSPEEVKAECCEPPTSSTNTPTPPQTTPQPPPPPPSPPPVEVVNPCAECEPIARDLALTLAAIAEIEGRINGIHARIDGNHAMQKALRDRIAALGKESNAGQWTAQGTDLESGTVKDYDATRGDGMVHVTVRDATGKVVSEYQYPRSKNISDARAKSDALQAQLKEVEKDEAYLQQLLKTAEGQLAREEAERQRLQRALEECLERCHQLRTRRGEVFNPCPECDAIAHNVVLTRAAVMEAQQRSDKIKRQIAGNQQAQKQTLEQIAALESEAKGGKFTASATESDGSTKELDGTKGDGKVHVTVRDPNGKIIGQLSYPRRGAAEIQARIDELGKSLEGLKAEERDLQRLLETAQQQKARLEADLQRLEAALADCIPRCHRFVIERWMALGGVGGDFELHLEPNQMLFAFVLGYRPSARLPLYVVFTPEVKTEFNQATLSLPVGAQYDFALPFLKGLFAYPRLTLGYAVSFAPTPAGTFTTNLGVFSVVGGVKYRVNRIFTVALEPFGLTTFFNAGFASLAYRLAALAGVEF